MAENKSFSKLGNSINSCSKLLAIDINFGFSDLFIECLDFTELFKGIGNNKKL